MDRVQAQEIVPLRSMIICEEPMPFIIILLEFEEIHMGEV